MAMLGELVEVIGLVIDAARKSDGVRKGGCRLAYEFYVAVEDLCDVCEKSINRGLGWSYSGWRTQAQINADFPSLRALWVQRCNAQLSLVPDAYATVALRSPAVLSALEITDPELKQSLNSVLSAKGDLFEAFARMYDAGNIDVSTLVISRRWFRPIDEVHQRARPRLVEQVEQYDLTTNEALQALIATARANITGLRAVNTELREFIRRNCTLDSLLGATD